MSSSSHDALRDLLGAYALDAVEADERALLEEHLRTCGECRDEVDRHRTVAGMIAGAETPLPDGLWDRVRGGIAREAPHTSAEVTRLSTHRRWTPILSAAAVSVLVALVGVQTVRLQQTRNDLAVTAAQLAAIEQAVTVGDYASIVSLAATAPGAVTVALDGDAGTASATILPYGSGYLELDDLAPLDEAHTYQLWAVIDDEVISAGVFGGAPTVAPFRVDLERLQGLVVTSEVAGGVAVSSQPAASAWLENS